MRALQERTGVQCGLATVMVGDDPASAVYVGNKHRACHEAGMASFDIHLPGDIDQDGLHAKIDEVCADPLIHGMIVQLPLPSHLDEDAALDRIVYTKDADGLTPAAQGRLATLRPGPRPATPNGVVELLRRYEVELERRARGHRRPLRDRRQAAGAPAARAELHRHHLPLAHARPAVDHASGRRPGRRRRPPGDARRPSTCATAPSSSTSASTGSRRASSATSTSRACSRRRG